MNSLNLLDRIKDKDSEAFNDLMKVYGKRVYVRLLNQLGDRELADKAFKKTMLEFYESISKSEADDPIEALLYDRANAVQKEMIDSSLDTLIRETAEEAQEEAEEEHIAVAEKFDAAFPAQPEVNEAAPAAEETEEKTESSEAEAEAELPEEEIKKNPHIISTLIIILLLAAVIWVAVGGLMTAGYIPKYDLGYQWFNNNIYSLFVMT